MALIGLPVLLATTMIAQQKPDNQSTVFRLASDYYHRTVIVRDTDNKFVPDLKPEEFRVYEDGALQKITTLFANIGGRALSGLTESRTAAPVREGLILPATRPPADTSGRLFIVFIDDLHLQATDTPRVKDVLKKVRDILVHENDLVGFVSSGKSNIAIDPSYDFGHRRFNEVINRVMGEGLTMQDILAGVMTESKEGPQQVRSGAHIAQMTALETLQQLAQFSDRRKAFVYVSNGYDYNPLKESRWQITKDMYTWMDDSGPFAQEMAEDRYNKEQGTMRDPKLIELDQNRYDEYKKKTEFSNADLTQEMVVLAREASRNSITFYPLDPRGLQTTNSDISVREKIPYADIRDLRLQQYQTLDLLAHETGGFCICQTNDFESGLRRIDNEMSDYYELGYRTNNPDPMKLRRTVKIEVTRPGLHVENPTSDYWLPKPLKK
jgi:VWFA-related protein